MKKDEKSTGPFRQVKQLSTMRISNTAIKENDKQHVQINASQSLSSRGFYDRTV
jgi:hypothetical protein